MDSLSDGYPKFVAIDEEANHQIVHRGRFGKTNGATYQPFDPGPQIDMLAFDLLRMSFATRVLLGIEMALVGSPSIGVKACDAKGRSQVLECEKDGILSASKYIG